MEEKAAMSLSASYALLLPLAIVLVFPGPLSAQARRGQDSLKTAHRDSSGAGARKDSVKASGSSSGIDTVVTYAAGDSVRYDLKSRTMYMFGRSDIRYR
ncbi:MAG TPA: hypothetical protein VK569_06590, partial [Bacteroidota bacterium]|nr:hypothetical protein [Bacteroidota bacterium]